MENALDYGINEKDFWEMSLDELTRAIESKRRVQKQELQRRANFDYTLAELIGRSVSRIYSANAKMPSIEEVYTDIFDDKMMKEQRQKQQDNLSAIRFKQFADSFNRNFKEVAKTK